MGSKQDFSNWITNRIKKYGFIEGQDYIVFNKFVKNSQGGRSRKEYGLTIDTAKEISMVENNEKSRQDRRYFIEAEKQYIEIVLLDFNNPVKAQHVPLIPEKFENSRDSEKVYE